MELWFHYNHSLELVNLGHREDITLVPHWLVEGTGF